MDRQRRLSLPTGTETLHLLEAARHRVITNHLEELFLRWGYQPAETPLVDYFDVYRPHISERAVRAMYRAVDRQGEILVLRSDTTLFLARQLGLHLTPEDVPVRVFYNDQIVRAEAADEVSNNEYQQAGVELVGPAGVDADAEVILLALEALHELGLDDAVLHVGHRGLAESLIAIDGATERDDALPRLALRRGLAGEDPLVADEELRRALALIGPPSRLPEVRAVVERLAGAPPAARHAASIPAALTHLDHLEATCAIVARHAQRSGPALRVDLSEVGTNDYYTGIAVSAYLPDSNAAVLVGGRYDRLLASFGFDAPSCGFSIYTRKLPARVGAGSRPVVAHGDRTTLEARIAAARAAGRRAS